MQDGTTTELTRTIGLALTPVFLLTGIAAFLNVLASRLARIVDRTRALEDGLVPERPDLPGSHQDELRSLWTRRLLINRAITLCTYSALMVAGLVGVIFVGSVLGFNISLIVTVAFVAAIAALISGLLSFLQEVHIALRYLRGVSPSRRREPPR